MLSTAEIITIIVMGIFNLSIIAIVIKCMLDTKYGKYFYTYKRWNSGQTGYYQNSSYMYRARNDARAIKKANRKMALDSIGDPYDFELLCVCKKIDDNKTITIWDNPNPKRQHGFRDW